MGGETVVSEPSTFTVPVVLFENNLDPGTSVDLSIRAVDDIATGMPTSYYTDPYTCNVNTNVVLGRTVFFVCVFHCASGVHL